MNMQNLERPQYDENNVVIPTTGRLRRAIIAPKGHVIGVDDSAQIEARTNAWLSGHETLLETFRLSDRKEGPDPYRVQASVSYGKPVEEISKPERFLGKVQILGLGYKMGAAKLKTTLALGTMGPAVDISDEQAEFFVNSYRQTNKPIVDMWARCKQILIDMISGRSGEYKCISWEDTTLWLPNGLGLHYHHLFGVPDPHSDRWAEFQYFVRGKPTRIYDGLLLENIVQGLARCVIAHSLRNITNEFSGLSLRKNEHARVVSMTHDELIAVFPERLADKCMEIMRRNMVTGPKWAAGLPLADEGGYDVRYSK